MSTSIDIIHARDKELAERLGYEDSMQVCERFLRYLSRRHTTDFSV